MVFLKKAIPIILIIIILGVSIYSYIDNKNKEVSVPDLDLKGETKNLVIEKTFEDGNMENSGGASTIYVENIELINEFLDLDMMLRYKDLVTNYGLLLPGMITNDIEKYYKDNVDLISKAFGIYSFSDFEDFYSVLDQGGLNKDDTLTGISIKSLTQEGNLLKADVVYLFSNKEIRLQHYISYVFINDQPQIFIYN